MVMRSTKIGAVIAATLFLGQAAWAAPVSPDYDTFGNLTMLDGSPVIFGGSGIPTDPSVIRTFQIGQDTIRLGMIATPRYSSPAVGNDGAGTYSATAGESSPGAALWNFSFFAQSTGDLLSAGIRLFYDFDPAAGTDLNDMGIISGFFGSVVEESENLGFGYLAAGIPPFVTPPSYEPFDPFAAGEYSFRLEARDGQGVAMNVNIAPVPLPAALPLLAGALGGLAFVGRRRRRRS